MRVRHRKRAIPHCWKTHPKAKGLVYEADIRIGSSKLAAKLLIFSTLGNLQHFWKEGLGRPKLGSCLGAVTDLACECYSINKNGEKTNHRLEVDPRYYCVIGLVRKWCFPEVLAHEAGHAAFRYAKRVTRSPWSQEARRFDEEAVCYPLGRIYARLHEEVLVAGAGRSVDKVSQ